MDPRLRGGDEFGLVGMIAFDKFDIASLKIANARNTLLPAALNPPPVC